MKKWIKSILILVLVLILLVVIDLICIFNISKPLFAIKENNGYVYRGLFYDTYNCPEYSIPQIKSKTANFNCTFECKDVGKVDEILDTTKSIDNFACAEALESFYEDNHYIYFWSCMKNQYMIVRYESGFEETISDALKYGTITISDLDRYKISYIKQEK